MMLFRISIWKFLELLILTIVSQFEGFWNSQSQRRCVPETRKIVIVVFLQEGYQLLHAKQVVWLECGYNAWESDESGYSK